MVQSLFIPARNVEVYYPPGFTIYGEYAIILMHDGQNVFNDSTAYGGVAWNVDDVMDSLLALNVIRPAVIVAVWNNPNRWSEYLPEDCITGQLDSNRLMPYARPEVWNAGVYSRRYLYFLVDELLPLIDYEILPRTQWQDVFVMGSSMGGLISAYAVSQYSYVFNGAACLSTHWPALDGACVPYFQNSLANLKNHLLYFDYGSAGLDSLYQPYQDQLDSAMLTAGFGEANYRSEVFPDADHNEESWHKRVEVPLMFLLADRQNTIPQ